MVRWNLHNANFHQRGFSTARSERPLWMYDAGWWAKFFSDLTLLLLKDFLRREVCRENSSRYSRTDCIPYVKYACYKYACYKYHWIFVIYVTLFYFLFTCTSIKNAVSATMLEILANYENLFIWFLSFLRCVVFFPVFSHIRNTCYWVREAVTVW
jgi:hypothetical protein